MKKSFYMSIGHIGLVSSSIMLGGPAHWVKYHELYIHAYIL